MEKFLFIGLGGIGQRHLRNLCAIMGERAEIHAYRVRKQNFTLTDQLEVEANTNLQDKFRIRLHGDLDEALAVRPTAVFVCNPSSLHVPVAIKAAAAGCHLFIEKPLAHNLDGVDELIATVREKRLVGLVGYQLRFHPCLKYLHAILAEGMIGRPLAARVEVGEYLPGWHRYEDYRQMYASRADLGGGVILSQIHEFDYLCWFFGLPKRVFTIGGHYSSLEIDVEDVAQSSMEFALPGGPMAVQVHQDYVQRPPSRGCTIIGDSGKVVMDLRSLGVTRYDAEGNVADKKEFQDLQRNQLFLDEMNHFLGCLQGEAKPVVPIEQGAQSLRLALAARESMKTGRVVQLKS
jgi:predicted dehydrogenase